MISMFLLPLAATLILILMEILITKRKNSPRFYIQFLLFVTAARLLFFIVHVDATEEVPKMPTFFGIKMPEFPQHKMWGLTQKEYDHYDWLYLDHCQWGHAYFNDAEQMTWYIKKS